MRRWCIAALVLAGTLAPLRGQEFLEQLSERLTFSTLNDNVRGRFSGILDLEFYAFQQPPPGLIDAAGETLFNPRLTLFFDAQLGGSTYFFAQARVDRHFDPTDEGAQIRLDEYALRVTPWDDGRLSVQVGKFATVTGVWVARHLSWDNPFINAPLAYEHATALEDLGAPELPFDGLLHDEKYEYIPIVWGPSYASGVSVAGRIGNIEYAAEVKNASLASRPESWDVTRIGFDHPTVSARLGFRPNEMWNFGFSASDGAYFRPDAIPSLPAGTGIGDYHQTVLVQDVSFAWRHLQLWAEVHEARFEVPRIGDADSVAYFLEAKYKITPQLFGAVRWNQQFFNKVSNGAGGRVDWSRDVSRFEAAVGYRFTANTQLKLQYYLTHEADGQRDVSHTFATQLTVRF